MIGLAIMVCVLFLPAGKVAAQVKPVRRVLVIYEAGLSSPGVNIADQELRAVLENSDFQIELYREYMETILFPDPTTQKEFQEWYIRKYRDRKPDVIVTIGPSPLDFMVNSHEEFFHGIPVVFGGLTVVRAEEFKLGADFTGVDEESAPEKTLEAALRLQPGTKHVVVVGGTAPFDRGVEMLFRERLSKYESKLDISYWTDLAMPELLQRLHHLPDHTVVLMTSFGKDAVGTRFITGSQSAPMIERAANAPVFGASDSSLGHGEVGGYVISFATEGKIIGNMVISILKGAQPQDIPTIRGMNAYIFDSRALRRWGFRESRLPPGSILINREPTLWQTYKGYIIASIFLLLAQALIIAALLRQIRKTRRTESALRESEERFRLVANTAPVMIWVCGADKLCTYFNQTWLFFTGRSLEQELGNGWVDSVHPDDVQDCLKTYTEAFERRWPFTMEYRLRRHDGEYRWITDTGVPRFNSDRSFAGYIGSCMDVTERRNAQEALADVGRRLIEAQEEERTWIGRELHDDINQRLALVAVGLDRSMQNLSREEVNQLVSHACRAIQEIVRDIQGISHRLHSSKLEYLGLASAASSFCKELSAEGDVHVTFRHSGVPKSLPREISLSLFRILQEALQNAVKYSGVREFEVELRGTVSEVQLSVSDHGRGFDPQKALRNRGLGLISMQQRTELVHGQFSIKSSPGHGTRIQVSVPLEAEHVPVAAAG